MTNRLNIALATAAVALATGLGAAPSIAFDDSTWTWTKSQTDDGERNTKSWLWALPDGDASIESDQTKIGNVGADVMLDSAVIPPAGFDNDASVDLPGVEGTAGAYGNVVTIESEVPISADIRQTHAGAYDPTAATATDATATVDSTLGTATEPVVGTASSNDQATTDARSGVLLPHSTNATVTATGIDQATIDIEARAISNSSSMTLTSAPASEVTLGGDGGATLDGGQAALRPLSTNALLSSDEKQFSYGDTSATATSSQTITDMRNLGTVDRPINRVGATAIGNLSNHEVKFAAPDAAN